LFSVKSAYKEITQRRGYPEVLGSSSTADEQTWKSLWKLRVMPKIRVFWWRVIKNLLPCASELRRRHIKQISFCPMCGHDNETLYHALIECEHARSFWRSAEEFFGLNLPRLHTSTWCRDVLDPDIVGKREATIAVSVMWTILGSRNNYDHGEVKYQPRKSMDLVDELIKSLEIPCTREWAPAGVEVQKWLKPDQGWVKLNCDGALDIAAGVAGVGIIVRDHPGAFVAAECRKYEHIVDPGTTEILACHDAILFAKAKGWSHVVLETDCQSIVTAWREGRGAQAVL
jgi:hypothetical protein